MLKSFESVLLVLKKLFNIITLHVHNVTIKERSLPVIVIVA